MSSNETLVDESRVPQILAGIIIPTLLSSIFVLARLYTRIIITRNWGHDDTLITVAWITALSLAIINALLIPFGSGHHVQFQKLSQIIPTLKIVFIARLLYQFVLCITKLSICIFYLRVFQDKKSKRHVYVIALFTTVSALIIEFVFIFQCNPVSDAWAISNGNCKPANPSVIANAVCNIVADVWNMGFVIPRVLPLQMARRQKVSLLVVVGLGVVVIAASVVRCVLVTQLATNDDPTWNGYDITTWTTLEVSTGLFCASAPCIRPLLRQMAPGLMSSISHTVSGPSKNPRTRTYGLGSAVRGKQKEVFELSSRGEGGTFLDERSSEDLEDGNGEGRSVGKENRNGKGRIVKTVEVKVSHGRDI